MTPHRTLVVVAHPDLAAYPDHRAAASAGHLNPRPRIVVHLAGHNRFTGAELLRPLDATAHLCGPELAEPLVLHSAPRVAPEDLAEHAARYRELLAPVTATAGS